MNEERMLNGSNFTGFHAGPKEEWKQYRLDRPEVPIATRGKLFLRKYLESQGLEISLNSIPPGKGIPFLHRHQENDEVYIVVGGKGQFQIDGQCVGVQEGSVLRMSPPAARAFRNTLIRALFHLHPYHVEYCFGRASDGRSVEQPLVWPDRLNRDRQRQRVAVAAMKAVPTCRDFKRSLEVLRIIML